MNAPIFWHSVAIAGFLQARDGVSSTAEQQLGVA